MSVRKGQADFPLPRQEFSRRFRARFTDPAFKSQQDCIDQLEKVAWDAYAQARKSPVTRKAGTDFHDPDYELSVEWLATREAIQKAEAHHRDPARRNGVLLICGSPRNDKTCPGEMSKTFRLTEAARLALESTDTEVDLLDLSTLNSEFGKVIYPCKGCVSTAMPLCHWPCSCYPNHALGQVDDWMSALYPRWVAAHGIMIITPVHWYQAPSVLKLMMDRLVCADGGNPDPSRTHGKHAEEAKALEEAGWSYPRHLKGRVFAVVTHGDAAGAESLRRGLTDWLSDMQLIQAGSLSCIDRMVGYLSSYSSSHQALDKDLAFMEEVRNAARALATGISEVRAGQVPPDQNLKQPRPK